MLTRLANFSGKSTRHKAAETAKPWVDMSFIGTFRDFSVALGLRGKREMRELTAYSFTVNTAF